MCCFYLLGENVFGDFLREEKRGVIVRGYKLVDILATFISEGFFANSGGEVGTSSHIIGRSVKEKLGSEC